MCYVCLGCGLVFYQYDNFVHCKYKLQEPTHKLTFIDQNEMVMGRYV